MIDLRQYILDVISDEPGISSGELLDAVRKDSKVGFSSAYLTAQRTQLADDGWIVRVLVPVCWDEEDKPYRYRHCWFLGAE